LASSENGVLYALNSSSGELLWERGLSFRLEGAPVISPDHRVFYRWESRYLVCIEGV